MTSLPAQILGVRDRGLLREGYRADVVVFDPERIVDRATYEQPKQYASGVEHVLVNGVQVVDDGNHRALGLSGQVVYGRGKTAV